MSKQLTREEWLHQIAKDMIKLGWFNGYTLPAYRLGCGLPSKRAFGAKKRVVGQCWHPDASADKTVEIFISPTLANPVEVAATLLHELIHAVTGVRGHGGKFRALAIKLGLGGKMTETVPGDALTAKLKGMAAKLGAYPHAKLDYSKRPKQGTRLLKATCGGCGYTVRLTRKWAEQCLPICGACDEAFQLDGEG